ncbi:acyltransferase family protein [Ancylobacter sp. G4_0304]|uniref:acyltransferase family protein n=1 Tax=Ancylobacter sp. G4_0304 TaxID=3114289 RepID=UPI0039C643A8
MAHMSYRPEIDGLRTFAVMPVVLFHAGFTVFSGGFVGVDIFFVISGYLISRIILTEVAEKRFTFRRFYERRIRRIIPALLVVILVTLAAASWIALPDQLTDIAKSALAALLSGSNIWFWTQSGYFGANAEFMPLLHTWSLAVEEQFYILFPIGVLVLARLRLPIGLTIALLLIPAFALSVWMSYNKPTAAFYLLPARGWELGLGAVLASGVVPAIRNRQVREGAALVGLGLVVFAIFWIDNSVRFPGWAALLPCVGAGLIIYASGEGGLVQRLLSLRPIVFIGLISYSLYLWHWPVFALTRLYEADIHLGIGYALGGTALSFVLAVLTWRYVEQPFRGNQMPFSRVARTLSGATAVVTAAAVALIISVGLPGRLNEQALRLAAASSDIDHLVDPCQEGEDRSNCRFGPALEPVRYMIVGDSHAAALRPAFDGEVQGIEGAGTMWWSGRCAMLDGARLTFNPPRGCPEFRVRVMTSLRQSPEISTVVLAGRWRYYLTGELPEERGASSAYFVDDQTVTPSEEESRLVFERALGRTLDELQAMGKRVIIVGGVPEPGFDVPHILALAELHGQPSPTIDSADAQEKERVLEEIFRRAVASRPNAYYVPVADAFCTGQQCRLLIDGTPLYHDDDHIAAATARNVLGPLMQGRIPAALQISAPSAPACAASGC